MVEIGKSAWDCRAEVVSSASERSVVDRSPLLAGSVEICSPPSRAANLSAARRLLASRTTCRSWAQSSSVTLRRKKP